MGSPFSLSWSVPPGGAVCPPAVVASMMNPSATATVGSVVSFAVAKDVVVNGFTVAHAGTPVTGKITDVRRGSHETNRNGRLKIELNKLEEGKTVKLRLATIRWTSRICIRKALTDAAIWIVFFPFVLRDRKSTR